MSAHAGSRRSVLSALKPGQSAVFEAPQDRGNALMQQISTDIQRLKIPATLSLVIGVSSRKPRVVYEIIRVLRRGRKK